MGNSKEWLCDGVPHRITEDGVVEMRGAMGWVACTTGVARRALVSRVRQLEDHIKEDDKHGRDPWDGIPEALRDLLEAALFAQAERIGKIEERLLAMARLLESPLDTKDQP